LANSLSSTEERLPIFTLEDMNLGQTNYLNFYPELHELFEKSPNEIVINSTNGTIRVSRIFEMKATIVPETLSFAIMNMVVNFNLITGFVDISYAVYFAIGGNISLTGNKLSFGDYHEPICSKFFEKIVSDFEVTTTRKRIANLAQSIWIKSIKKDNFGLSKEEQEYKEELERTPLNILMITT
jgi:hypothetical protein